MNNSTKSRLEELAKTGGDDGVLPSALLHIANSVDKLKDAQETGNLKLQKEIRIAVCVVIVVFAIGIGVLHFFGH